MQNHLSCLAKRSAVPVCVPNRMRTTGLAGTPFACCCDSATPLPTSLFEVLADTFPRDLTASSTRHSTSSVADARPSAGRNGRSDSSSSSFSGCELMLNQQC